MDFSHLAGFDWDQANKEKNWSKHRVDYRECEEVFFNNPLFVFKDLKHSEREERFCALGVTDAGKELFLSFTVRGNQIRVISARPQSKKERMVYETHFS